MRRASSILLILLLSFPLITPLLSAPTGTNLPACCRRDGKHGCSMDKQRTHAGESFANATTPCPMYPSAKAMPLTGAATPPPARVSISLTLAGPNPTAQVEAHYRISFSRAWQKRGPPSPLS